MTPSTELYQQFNMPLIESQLDNAKNIMWNQLVNSSSNNLHSLADQMRVAWPAAFES